MRIVAQHLEDHTVGSQLQDRKFPVRFDRERFVIFMDIHRNTVIKVIIIVPYIKEDDNYLPPSLSCFSLATYNGETRRKNLFIANYKHLKMSFKCHCYYFLQSFPFAF